MKSGLLGGLALLLDPKILLVVFLGTILRRAFHDAAHPPAGATTVIVSLGLLSTWDELAAMRERSAESLRFQLSVKATGSRS